MNITTLGIDIAKSVFQLYAVDSLGKKQFEKRIKREKLVEFIVNLTPCCIIMEACGSSNYWARKFVAMGHEVKLIAPQYVKPFVKGNKNDSKDAQAIVEAASRPEMRFVKPKQVVQQDMQSLLRIREGYIDIRTKISNQIRGLLAEYGITMKLGIGALRKTLPSLFEKNVDNELTPMMKELLETQYTTLIYLQQQIDECDIRIAEIAKNNEYCQRLLTLDGVGVITAVAMVAMVWDGKEFKNGRHFAAFLGLVPRQHSSGGRERLLGISKRGDGYLRQLFIHGGRSVVLHADKKTDSRSLWVKQLKERRGMHRTCVAVANKNARIAMAMLLSGEEYKKVA